MSNRTLTNTELKPKGKGPCPTWFLARCMEVSRGGAGTFAWAGRDLLGSLPGETPFDYTFDEWDAKLDELEKLLKVEDDRAVIAWFARELPRCLKLVPTRRRAQFLSGMYKFYREEGLPR